MSFLSSNPRWRCRRCLPHTEGRGPPVSHCKVLVVNLYFCKGSDRYSLSHAVHEWMIHSHLSTRTCARTYTYTQTHVHAHARTRARSHARTHTHKHAHTRTNAHTHTHTHTHTVFVLLFVCFAVVGGFVCFAYLHVTQVQLLDTTDLHCPPSPLPPPPHTHTH